MDEINCPYLKNVFTSDRNIKIYSKYQLQPQPPDLSSKCSQREWGATVAASPELNGHVTFQIIAAEVP